MTFEERVLEAKREWEAFIKKPRIYVGTATCGRASGAAALIELIKKELKKSNIAVNVVEVGCIGLCYAEPLVDIVGTDGVRVSYRNVTPEIIPQLINEHLINGNPVAALALGVVDRRD